MIRLLVAIQLLTFSLFAQAASHSNTLTWTWTQGTGDAATGFHVQKAPTCAGPFTTIASPSVITLTYTDTAVTAGQTNCYQVTAFNAGGDSAPSNQVTCVTPFQTPTAPTGLSSTVK